MVQWAVPVTGSPGWLVVLLVVVCAVEATLLFGTLMPGEVMLVLVAGAAQPRYLPLMVLAAAVGSFAGQYAGYWLGRATGDRLRFSWVGRRLGSARWHRGELLMQHATMTTMIAVRFVAVAHTLAPVAAGALRMPHRRFVRLTVPASVVWAIVWIAVGVATGATGQAMDNTVLDSPVVAIVLGTVGVVVAGFALGRVARRLARTTQVSRETVP